MIDLSVLVCSTHTRWRTFGQAIQTQLWDQLEALPEADQNRIEILFLADNKAQMLGQKRNIMVDAAQGRYVQFIDDDDRIEPDMFRLLLDAIAEHGADVITFLVSVSVNGETPKLCRYSKDFPADRNTLREYQRLPNHICVVRRDLSRMVSFPNVAYGEDSAYAKLLLPHLKTEHHIPKVLYHYDYSSQTTEAQAHVRGVIRKRMDRPPVVDVVILSDAPTTKLRNMTQRAIDSCIAGANSLSVNIVVLESQPCSYRNATTLHRPEPFNYNRFANIGAAAGSARWIMIANNDVLFHDGWLHHLLGAAHPVVSPKCPRDGRQRHVVVNTVGYENAVHFSGWCFMLKRELWQQIGGFDDCVTFWCSDDVTIEQLRAIDVKPMLVPAACVTHLVSATLKDADNRDHLTWEQVYIFNERYGRDKFADDPRYQRYKESRPELTRQAK